jgi:hypothetical protein
MKETEKDKKEEPRRRNGPARLSAELPALTKTAFRNTMGGRGFAEASARAACSPSNAAAPRRSSCSI